MIEPLHFVGLWCKRDDESTYRYNILTTPQDNTIMMPFGGYTERYEVCDPKIWFRGFALATKSDFDLVKDKCNNFKNYEYITVIDPYDDEYLYKTHSGGLPPYSTRLALRINPYSFAPGDAYMSTGEMLKFPGRYWSLIDVQTFPNSSFVGEKWYDPKKCALSKCCVAVINLKCMRSYMNSTINT